MRVQMRIVSKYRKENPRTLLEEVRQIQSVDVCLPTDDGHELRLRCVVKPERAQEALLGRLGIRLPRRLQPAALHLQGVVETSAS